VVLPFQRRPAKPSLGPGGEYARVMTESLVRDIAGAVGRLSTADKNRVLLALASFIATQLEALETNTDV
jgi:hypothetical protein